jgi:hypothetical protein
MLRKKLSKAPVLDPRSLPKAVKGFLKTADVMRMINVFKIGWLGHIYFLVQCAVKKGGANVELCEIKVLNSNNG